MTYNVFSGTLNPTQYSVQYFFLLSFFFLFFPRLISAVGDWMSTILPHMVWPALV